MTRLAASWALLAIWGMPNGSYSLEEAAAKLRMLRLACPGLRPARAIPGLTCATKNLIQRNWGGPPSVRRLVSGRFRAMPKRCNERLAKQKSVSSIENFAYFEVKRDNASLPASPPGMKMMHRPVAGADGEPVGGSDRGADIGLCLADRVREREAAGESRRDRRG
jgi:hypothetical protein